MTPEQEEELRQIDELPKLISSDDLADKSDRTLLYGYDTDRRTWHVYLVDGMIHLHVYTGWSDANVKSVSMCSWDVVIPSVLVPNKRLYPECCDYEFCKLLKMCGEWLSFTKPHPGREPAQFYGRRF